MTPVYFRKGLVLVIICLFVGACFVPSISGNMEQTSYNSVSLNLTDGPVGFWTFDEGTGYIAHDYSGNSNDGMMHGPTWIDGISGKALGFGGNDGVHINDDSSLEGFSELTILVWANPYNHEGGNMGYVVGKYVESYAVRCPYRIWAYEGDWIVELGDGSDYCIARAPIDMDNQWYHLALWWDGVELKLFVNGNVKDSAPALDHLYNNNEYLRIGERVNDGFFNGLIDEVRIYDRALNNNEIRELYNNPGGVPDKPTISGPRTGKPKQEYDYSFSSSDPDDDTIYYYIDWDDDQVEEWIGPFPSGFEVKLGHTWEEKGNYVISAKSKDNAGKESDLATFAVSMPKNKIINPFERFLENHPYMFPILRHIFGLQ